jgi:AAHS family 4-hydroxybenzoate transporter-like MFS transporter
LPDSLQALRTTGYAVAGKFWPGTKSIFQWATHADSRAQPYIEDRWMGSHADDVHASSLRAIIDQSPIRAIQIFVLLLCTLVTLIEGVDLALVPLLANSIKTALSLEQRELGFVLSALPVGLMVGGVVMGYLGDRLGRRPSLIASMVLMTLATLATSFANSLPALLACRVLTGIAFGGVFPAAMALISEFMPARVRTNVLAFVGLGVACGQLTASMSMKHIFLSGPWQAPVVYVAAACGVVTLLLAIFLPESPRYLLLT